MTDFFSDFLHHLRAEGYEPVRSIAGVTSGTWPRLRYNGEKPGSASGGYKITQNPDGSYFAVFGSQKDPLGFRSFRQEREGEYELTYEQKIAAKVAREECRRAIEAAELRRQEKIAKWLKAIVRKYPEAKADHPYLMDKEIGAHGIKQRPKTGELVIPRYGADGKLWSVQRIVQKTRGKKSWKGYMKGALGKGLYFPLATKDQPKDVVVICEGFATGASIREATRHVVVVAFDAGALSDVAQAMRRKYPDARLVIAADNDQWTFAPGKKPKDVEDAKAIAGNDPRWAEWRYAGKLSNVGEIKAKNAAEKVGGAFVLLPDFPADHEKKGTDFNDLVIERGLAYVAQKFTDILEIPRVPAVEEASVGGVGEPSVPDVQAAGAGDPQGDLGMSFRILGYNNGVFYYYPFGMGQIVALPSAGHSINNLMQLDTLDAWERNWRDGTGKLLARHPTIALYAAEAMMRIATKRGVFKEEDRIRGCGAWIDDGRVILHCGDAAYVDGERQDLHAIKGDFVYTRAARLLRPAKEALSNMDARRLRTICESVTWENKLSGSLLAGWLVMAPICAALQFRPHIFITGEAESGKSTVMDKIIKPALGRMSLNVDGKTTEPSIRQRMGYDARPLVFDEAEPSGNMEDVIGLARLASTGGVVSKAGQAPFKARFSACFSAVTPPVNKTTDESRITFMVLKKNLRPTAIQEYDALLALIDETIHDDFAERLLARTLNNMQALLANIRVFQRAARKAIGGARASQRIGTLLAGLYLLGRTDTISEEDAIKWIKANDWKDHANLDQEGDPLRLVQWIAASMVRFHRTMEDTTIGELIYMVHARHDHAKDADTTLRNHGIVVSEGAVVIASRSQNLAKLLRGTDWQDRWSRPLGDVPGAVKKASAYFSRGVRTSAVSLPIELFIGTDIRPVQPDMYDDNQQEERDYAY